MRLKPEGDLFLLAVSDLDGLNDDTAMQFEREKAIAFVSGIRAAALRLRPEMALDDPEDLCRELLKDR